MPPAVVLVVVQFFLTLAYLVIRREPRLWPVMAGNLILLVAVGVALHGALTADAEARQAVAETRRTVVELRQRDADVVDQAIRIGALTRLRDRTAVACR